ncbi:A disintegrin and metalloproteinase with thrombospondin motifs 19-like [Chanos chanos]|uniref:A disintegrin and metalloproteinase with thrombospondin motifs 19-like n=1 Tax=Chanos chanos TaxID=29144 RepID=A0A6J2UWK5_CHACN|nr:A disintegrin and metalloproteinase with thrombospondin motifs 19 [Chanos chanos]
MSSFEIYADPQHFQNWESEIIFPELFSDTSPLTPHKPNSRKTDASAGSSSREARSISDWEEYASHRYWDSSGPQTFVFSGLRLKIPAFGKELQLILKRDMRFLSQKFTVERKLKARKASPRATPTLSSAERACYYSGTVLNYSGSIASFSTCAGLMGFIQLSEDFLFIEPVNHTVSVMGHAHRVYRRKRSIDKKSDKQSRVNYCAVISDRQTSKTRKPSESGRGKRYSFKLHHEYNIETLVVADPAMVSYHGSEAVKRFILTIMNMVFNLFQHKSLGIQINIRLTKLVLLSETPTGMYIGHHGEKMLESFCRWQQEEYGRKTLLSDFSSTWRDDFPSVDTAILITRKDFCVHKDEPCDTVGIAYLSGMCSEKRKCILAEDNGLNLAFTIAHEMGHNMGMSHDSEHSACKDGLHIMSGEWVKGQNLGEVSWSQCSREDMEKFLRSKASSCLLQTDPMNLNSVVQPSKLPGMTYTADEQCQILFGPSASHCQKMQYLMCSGLWCKVDGEDCKTKLDPPLDGTECGTGKWCRAGECVSRELPSEPNMGEWSSWGPWGACSRTCSTGVQSRFRKCDSSRSGSKTLSCEGSRVQYRLCENQSCPAGAPSFRDQQCQTFSRLSLNWHSVMDDEKPCTLFCSSSGREQPVLLADKVLDGTSCGPTESGMCANGTCQKVGCDGILGSLAREDHCGICNGNGKTCKVIKGDFNHTHGAGYVEAVVIPKGARRIRVVEEKPAQSYLALKDTSKHSINSDWKIEHPGSFSIAGTTVHYVRRGLWEKMSAKGPTTSPLHLMVLLFNDQNYGIHYEYTITAEPTKEVESGPALTPSEPLFMWTHSGWEDCHVVCGGGERKTIVTCNKIVNKTTSVVENRKCHHLTKPQPQVRKCNEQPCLARWMMTEWTSCSRTCGKGSQNRQVACTLQLPNGTLVKAKDQDCTGPKPAATQRCEGQDCLTVWEAGVWSECSVKCGRGVRHRLVKCTNPRKKCDLTTFPHEVEECEDYSKCYIWRTGDWAKCSVTCGKGMQSRVIQCMHKITGRHGNECFSSEKPAAYRPCQQQLCNNKVNVNTITSPRLAALTFKCLRDQWPVYCRVIREKNLCQDMRWYQRCCQTCRDYYAQKMLQRS